MLIELSAWMESNRNMYTENPDVPEPVRTEALLNLKPAAEESSVILMLILELDQHDRRLSDASVRCRKPRPRGREIKLFYFYVNLFSMCIVA